MRRHGSPPKSGSSFSTASMRGTPFRTVVRDLGPTSQQLWGLTRDVGPNDRWPPPSEKAATTMKPMNSRWTAITRSAPAHYHI